MFGDLITLLVLASTSQAFYILSTSISPMIPILSAALVLLIIIPTTISILSSDDTEQPALDVPAMVLSMSLSTGAGLIIDPTIVG
jgi:hypothetical protein